MRGQQTCPLTIHFNMRPVSSDVSIQRDQTANGLTAREIAYNNFEIPLMVFMPNITTNHAITYTDTHNYILTILIIHTGGKLPVIKSIRGMVIVLYFCITSPQKVFISLLSLALLQTKKPSNTLLKQWS